MKITIVSYTMAIQKPMVKPTYQGSKMLEVRIVYAIIRPMLIKTLTISN
jgi:hypothetical protein